MPAMSIRNSQKSQPARFVVGRWGRRWAVYDEHASLRGDLHSTWPDEISAHAAAAKANLNHNKKNGKR